MKYRDNNEFCSMDLCYFYGFDHNSNSYRSLVPTGAVRLAVKPTRYGLFDRGCPVLFTFDHPDKYCLTTHYLVGLYYHKHLFYDRDIWAAHYSKHFFP